MDEAPAIQTWLRGHDGSLAALRGAVGPQTPETDRYLRALVPPEDDRPPVPAGAYNVAAQILANEAGINDHQPAARVHLDDGKWLMLRAARIREDIAVSIERASPTEQPDLFRRSAGLTVREAELLDLLAAGAGNVNLDWPHRARLIWPHAASGVGG